MINSHLHILHLFPNTDDAKVNSVAQKRYDNLMIELDTQGITDYTIIEGYYDNVNTKLAIHKGHRKIVELAKAKGFDNVIIAEDDIVFTHPNSYKYFLSQIPESYDLFFSIIYSGEIENNRVLNGFSGGMSLYSISKRYFQEFLDLPINSHIDRQCGLSCHNHEFYVVPEYCVTQRGGHSYNLRRTMFYSEYLRDKKLYGVD